MFTWLKEKQVLYNFEKEAANIVDKRKLATSLLSTIDYVCKILSGSIFLLDKKTESYKLVAKLDIKENNPELIKTIYYHSTGTLDIEQIESFLSFKFDEEFIQLLTNRDDILTLVDFNNLSQPTKEKIISLNITLCIPLIIKDRLIGFVCIGDKVNKKEFSIFEKNFIKKICSIASENLEKILLYREVAQNLQALEIAYKQLQEYVHIIESEKEALEQAYLDITHTLIVTLEARDTYTRGHSDRVLKYSKNIAKLMNLPPEEIKKIELAASLHDIGKIGTRDRILLKEADLTPEERCEMKQHTEIGAKILNYLSFLEPIIPIIRGHHEKWDGSGYPDGLKGEQISLGARIIAVADAYDAMTTDRPYRKGMPPQKALKIIEEEADKQFDPNIVKIFIENFKEIVEN